MADRFEGEVVRPALLAGDDGVIRDTTFERCEVKGPAVLVFIGKTVVEHNRLEGTAEAIAWEIAPDRTGVLGAVILENCTFTGCNFTNIGFAGPREFLARFGL